jgi:tryptophanase
MHHPTQVGVVHGPRQRLDQGGGLPPRAGHASYLDAAAFCAHLPARHFPAQALVCALYRHAGIRAVEIGRVMFGAIDPLTGAEVHPSMELVRLAVPRRVYTQSHIDYVVEAIVEIHQQRQEIRGLRLLEAPPVLRHFTARFAEL